MEDLPDLMTTAEVADLTRAPQSTVRYWRFCGTGPCSFRVGRRVLYRRADVQRWLMTQQEADSSRRAS
jgi:DNA-binding transcriptional MerR regulator